MKRAKKSFWFLAGILLLLGFCFREDVLASSLTSLPSLSKAGIGEVVSSGLCWGRRFRRRQRLLLE